ncbi:MAG: nuclease-related domain-containing protein [Candidatus Paceibacterota bacterium]|jgi:hypothetical protein
MISNKESFVFKKYSSNKRMFKFAALVIFLILISGITFLYVFSYQSYLKYPFVATVVFLISLMIVYREGIKADKELDGMEKHNYFTWGRGAGAELIVKRSLMTLNDDYRIISDFQMDKGNIDHICIGPTGIFAIEVKAHKGVISYINNRLKRENQDISSFLWQAKRGSVYLNHLIKEKTGKDYFVVPVLVFPNAKIDNSINHQIEGVWIGGREFEGWVVENCRNFLSSIDVEEVSVLFQSI